MSKLVVFFSYTNNTKNIANLIKNKLGCEILEIKTVIPYSSDYQKVVNDEHNSQASKYLPQIQAVKLTLANMTKLS